MKKRVLSLVLAAVMLFGVFTLASCGKKSFDYAKNDLSAYINIGEKDYLNVPVSIETGITRANAYAELSTALVALSDEKLATIAKTDKAVAEDDIVALYYRGVILDAEGKEIGFDGGTNFGDEKPTWLYIGSDSFIDGFEEALIGKIPADSEMVAVSEGVVEEDDLIVLEIAGMYGDDKVYMSYENLAVKLDETDILTADMIAEIVGASVGEELLFDLSIDVDGDKENDSVIFAAKVEKKLEPKAEKISVKFPSDYQDTTLAGKDAFFYIVIEKLVSADAATVEALGYTAGDNSENALLAGAEKALIAKYFESVSGNDNAEELEATIKNAMWEAITGAEYDITYPAGTLAAYAKTEKNNLKYTFNSGSDSESLQSTYKTLDGYAAYVYGDEDWEAVIDADAKEFVKRKLIFYSIAKALSVNSATKEEKNAMKADIEKAYVDYYVQMYTIYNSIGGWGYTTEMIDTLAKNDAQATVGSMSDTFITESVIREKILDKLYEGYDINTLVKWSTTVFDAE